MPIDQIPSYSPLFFLISFKFYLFLYWLCLGLCCCMDFSLVAVHELLAVVSLVADQGL